MRENRGWHRCYPRFPSSPVPGQSAVAVIAAIIIVNAFLFFLSRGQTFVHIDAIAHVNKARGLWDNVTPGIRQLGSIWLPLPHLLIAPLTFVDALWINGLAGSLLSAACFILTSVFLFSTGYAWTSSRAVGWMAFLFFALNPRLLYLFTTPMTEPLMVACAIGLFYYLIRWAQEQTWTTFAMAALMAFAGTLTRYEGWALAAAAVALIPLLADRQRISSTILFAGAAAAGPMLWMIFNMVYFDDPLMFTYGRGSARDYAQEYFFRTHKTFATAGNLGQSISTFFIDTAYCVNPTVLWLGTAGLIVAMILLTRRQWKPTVILALGAIVPFAFYVYNLYSNVVPILLPGLVKDESQSIYNVRYGTIIAATVPLFAAAVMSFILRQAERRRAFGFLVLAPLLLPDPIPLASQESVPQQFTRNLFYMEAIHNQSFWMPSFVDIAKALKAQIDGRGDTTGLVLTNTRIIHPVVWATGIPMRRFVHEMNKGWWERNLNRIQPEIRWVITEEGDQLWHAQGKVLQGDFVEVASAKTPSTGVVHLYRRRESR
jgi:hypothetical protein